MKTKKTVIAVLTAALITAFFIGCNVLPDDFNLNGEQKKFTPSGKKRVRINLGNSNSNKRLILPDTSAYVKASAFAKFLLFVHDDDGGAYENLPNITSVPPIGLNYITYDGFSEDLLLDTGTTYTFTVFACNSSNEYQAWGISDDGSGNTGIFINNDGDDVVNITLKEVISPSGDFASLVSTGKFSWRIINPADLSIYTSATLTLAEMDDTPVGSTRDLKTDNSGIISNIPVGYYRLTIELGKPPAFQTTFVREVIHIWSGLETKYIPEARVPLQPTPPNTPPPTAEKLPLLRSLLQLVTINYGTDTASSLPLTKNAIHGNTISTALSNTVDPDTGGSTVDILAPTHTGDNNNVYYCQWRKNNISGTPITGDEKIISPITLYANWLQYKTPDESHYTITGDREQTVGSVDGISVVVKSVNPAVYSQGTVTVWYEDVSGLISVTDDPSSLPEGEYDVTFDVDAYGPYPYDNKWKAVTGFDAGKLFVVIPSMFKFHFDWTKGTEPEFDIIEATYNKITGKITLNITINNNSSWGTFEWFNDFDHTPLSTKLGEPYTIDLVFDAEDDFEWSVEDGEFAIYVELDNGASAGRIIFSLQ